MSPNGQVQPPVYVKLRKCPWCGSPWNHVYRTDRNLQRCKCDSCLLTFKAMVEEPDRPRPESTPEKPIKRKKTIKKTDNSST